MELDEDVLFYALYPSPVIAHAVHASYDACSPL